MTTIGPGITRQNAVALQGVPISTTLPTDTQVLKYVAATNLWTPSTDAAGTGTVTSITQGTGMSFSVTPITTTGTISLANTAVTPGTYSGGSITVDQQGRITAATNFRGALVPLLADQSITSTVAIWTTAIYDTGTFWTIANPTRLTVSTGVTKVRLSCHGLIASANGFSGLAMTKNGAAFAGRGISAFTVVGTGDAYFSAESSVVVVVAGDYFEVLGIAVSGTLSAVADTSFSIEVVQ